MVSQQFFDCHAKCKKPLNNKDLTPKDHDMKLLVLNDFRSANGGIDAAEADNTTEQTGNRFTLGHIFCGRQKDRFGPIFSYVDICDDYGMTGGKKPLMERSIPR